MEHTSADQKNSAKRNVYKGVIIMFFLTMSQILIFYIILLLILWLSCRKLKLGAIKFVIYAAGLLYLLLLVQSTLFPIITGDFYPDLAFSQTEIRNLQLVPFSTITMMIENNNWMTQVAGNVLLLLPVPFFLGFMRKRLIGLPQLLVSGLFSVGIEAAQLLENIICQYPNRAVDIDDILLNMLGILVGTLCVTILKKGNSVKESLSQIKLS
ncbi:VanZ family protein [Clostridiales bacterium]|nr:VanZ family protein [Clostridiales bacterium]